jgi:peptidyl-prolyl cis-trans isomerase D
LTVEESGDFSRNFGFFIPRIGTSQELAEAAFALTTESPVAAKVYTIGGRFLVASLKQLTVADFATLSDVDRDQLKNRLLADKKEQVVAEKIQQLLQQANVEIMVPELINAFEKGSNKS